MLTEQVHCLRLGEFSVAGLGLLWLGEPVGPVIRLSRLELGDGAALVQGRSSTALCCVAQEVTCWHCLL